MKKKYEKPATRVIMPKYKSHLLIGSPVDTPFSDDENYKDWDFDGGQ